MKFYKYQGTGNDFLIIDDREEQFPLHNKELIAGLCNRRFGIGADGLMLLRNEKGFDFRMIYYNADGNESSMCGNGGRCIALFARQMGIISTNTSFLAVDGPHLALFNGDLVELQMQNVSEITSHANHFVLNTGSPHYVLPCSNTATTDIITKAKAIRYNDQYKPNGINVNFIEWQQSRLYVRTYERGVEDETLSCGTGVTAAAIAWYLLNKKTSTAPFEVPITTPGGELKVKFQFNPKENTFTNVWLIGPAKLVFSGEVSF